MPPVNKLSIRDLDLAGNSVFIRVDYNVPLAEGKVADDTRIRQTIPTLQYAIDKGARLVLASHLGRPKGQPKPEFSLAPVVERLAALLGRPVKFVPDCIGSEAEHAAAALKPGEVLLLENLRFHPGEEKNDPDFARQLAGLSDGFYVDDAFGAAHRAHASVVGITRFTRRAAAGLLMERELTWLGKALENPERPFVAVIGGAKVSDKIEVIENLMKLADALLIGGALAYTFLKAEGKGIGASRVEDDKLDLARRLLDEARSRKFRLLLPVDHVVAQAFDMPEPSQTVAVDATPDGWMGLDIGPKTVAAFTAEIARARTIVWNGPMGVFEKEPFSKGTVKIAEAVAAATAAGAKSIVGGGDSIAAIHKAGVADRISHVSTGGGASLEFLSGRLLPGVAALTDKGGGR
jgi:phosphoglycerate kinase